MLSTEYLAWHYGSGLRGLVRIAKNYCIAHWYRFGIGFHLRTLFYPWRRQYAEDEKTDGVLMRVVMWAVGKIVDLYFRLVAAVVRLTVVLVGLVYVSLTACFFTIAILAWLLWPAVAVGSITLGVTLLFPH